MLRHLVFNRAGRCRTSESNALRGEGLFRQDYRMFQDEQDSSPETSCQSCLLRFLTFDDEFVLHAENPRHAARANVSELRVALVRDNTLERRVSTIDDQMNRRHRLRCVAK